MPCNIHLDRAFGMFRKWIYNAPGNVGKSEGTAFHVDDGKRSSDGDQLQRIT